MNRWVVLMMALGAAVAAAPGCDGDGSTSSSSTATTGPGGGGGSGGTTTTSTAAGCQPGEIKVSCTEGATHVALLDTCPPGTTELDMHQCDACDCTSTDAECTVYGRAFQDAMCTGTGPGLSFLETATMDEPCVFTGAASRWIGVYSEPTCPAAAPRFRACEFPADADPCPFPDACVPEDLAPWVPACLLFDDHVDCASVAPPEYQRAIAVYEGGTCNCKCAPTGTCGGLTAHETEGCGSGFAIPPPPNNKCVDTQLQAVPYIGVSTFPGCTAVAPDPMDPATLPTGVPKTLCCLGGT